MTIRPYNEKDKENVRYICLNSDGPCDADENGQHFLLTTYCDYYIEKEPHNCFILADNSDRAVGYILCARDFTPFWNTFLQEYMPRLAYNPAACRDAENSTVLHRQFKNEYPAHLHIDLLPEAQGHGYGPQLMETLFSHLRKQNCRGIMWCVWEQNERAQRFYERQGFTCIGKGGTNIAYGTRKI
ncbi:MAG: GNAT family N-acetyltransferase [Clostridia bacterium]|nr:GNAT family N-acetyltransferase [Clostridia bacterium]